LFPHHDAKRDVAQGRLVLAATLLRRFGVRTPDLILLTDRHPIMNMWMLALGVLALATTAWGVRLRRRRSGGITTDPVSSEWLAEARSREEHSW
jgi:hypothetical protein